ncbi:ABC transporter C-terminal domain-containing protein [Gemmobacter nanjingensis]|nr:ABC transporter C-terminal domain-containing protein [Gemmobacter nanjingensis]
MSAPDQSARIAALEARIAALEAQAARPVLVQTTVTADATDMNAVVKHAIRVATNAFQGSLTGGDNA